MDTLVKLLLSEKVLIHLTKSYVTLSNKSRFDNTNLKFNQSVHERMNESINQSINQSI